MEQDDGKLRLLHLVLHFYFQHFVFKSALLCTPVCTVSVYRHRHWQQMLFCRQFMKSTCTRMLLLPSVLSSTNIKLTF